MLHLYFSLFTIVVFVSTDITMICLLMAPLAKVLARKSMTSRQWKSVVPVSAAATLDSLIA